MSTSSRPEAQSQPSRDMIPRAERASLVHAVMCRAIGEGEFRGVETRNISQSGMLVTADALPSIGADLEFKFVLENGFVLLTGRGRVSRRDTDPAGVPLAGVAFQDLDPAQLRILARVVELHAAEARARSASRD